MSKVHSFIFTRYLYEKEEVEIHLLLSLLYKKQEDALFWAYELFYSGFEIHLLQYLLKIYYYFYACLNPNFENFLIKKIKEFSKSPEIQSKIIASIIQNLIIRPLNMDVFLSYTIQATFEIPEYDSFHSLTPSSLKHLWEEIFKQGNKVNIELLLYTIFTPFRISNAENESPFSLKTPPNVGISNEKWFKSSFQDPEFLLNNLIDYWELDVNKEKFRLDYIKNLNYILHQLNAEIDEKIILLSKIFYLYGIKIGKKMGKNLYVCVNTVELILYETIQVDLIHSFPAYKILPVATILEIQPELCKNLFQLKREKEDIRNAYLHHWLYYASKCPLWNKRIQDFKGIVYDLERKVIFDEQGEDDELLQSFYDNYGYEPDEQKKEVQNKCIGDENENKNKILISNWMSIYQDCGFNNRFIDIDQEYIEQLEIIDQKKF